MTHKKMKHVYIFVYGNERCGLISQNLLKLYEVQRQEAEAVGRLYARTVSFPAAVFDDEAQTHVIGDLVQLTTDSLPAALRKLAQAHGYTKKDDPQNLFELRQITVRLMGDGDNEVTGVYVFEAADEDRFRDSQLIEDGDWLAYREELSAQVDRAVDPHLISELPVASASVG